MEVDGQVVDLHGEATLTAIEVACLPSVELILRFRDAEGQPARLTFGAVTELSFRQDEDDANGPLVQAWEPDLVETFYGVEFEGREHGRGWFEVRAITGVLTFAAGSVTFRRS